MTASSALRSPTHRSKGLAEHELDLLESAIALVASGGASRVVVVMALGKRIPSTTRSTAGQRGVVLLQARRDDGGTDLIVEPAA
jgi:hypothetical protein